MISKEYHIPVVVTDVLSSDNVQITAVAHYGRFGDASGMNVAGLIFDRDNDVEIVVKPKPSDTPHAVTEGMAAFDAAALVMREEMLRAIRKHGIRRTPLSTDPTDTAMKLAVLVEEVGEVASALTYDRGDRENLKAELVQVAAMALAWRASLD